jgi:hypothetical protein
MLPYRLRARISEARKRLQRGVRQAVFGGEPTWRRRPNTLPWFDRPDAPAGQNGDEILTRWVRDGYVVVDGLVAERDVDEMVRVLDALWDATEPIADLELIGLREAIDGPQRSMAHRDLLALPPADRHRLRDASDWRIHGFHYVNAAAKRIYWDRRLGACASRIFARRSRPIAAINFMSGSEQELHQDMAVFHIFPHNYLIGAWIACEDITPDSGPLVIYPGSHRAPFFPGFTDYPQTNLRTADAETAPLPGVRRRHRARLPAPRVPGEEGPGPVLARHADPRRRAGDAPGHLTKVDGAPLLRARRRPRRRGSGSLQLVRGDSVPPLTAAEPR